MCRVGLGHNVHGHGPGPDLSSMKMYNQEFVHQGGELCRSWLFFCLRQWGLCDLHLRVRIKHRSFLANTNCCTFGWQIQPLPTHKLKTARIWPPPDRYSCVSVWLCVCECVWVSDTERKARGSPFLLRLKEWIIESDELKITWVRKRRRTRPTHTHTHTLSGHGAGLVRARLLPWRICVLSVSGERRCVWLCVCVWKQRCGFGLMEDL